MAQIKTSELAASLTRHEVGLFEKYLQSPYFNCSAQIADLFKMYLSDGDLTREDMHRELFPGKPYNDKQMRYVISDLNKHIEQVLVYRQIEKDPIQEKIIKSKALSVRECDKANTLSHFEIINIKGFYNADYFLKQYEHAEMHMNFINRKATRKTTPDYSSTLQNLDSFYILKKLQLACEVTNMANILKKQYDIVLLREILNAAAEKPFCDIPHIMIYKHLLQTLSAPEEDSHFHTAGALLKQEGERIHPAELSEMYQYIRNYCVRKINQGNTNYVRVLFNIYNDMLTNKPLMKHDYLSQWEFKNIVTISLRLGETKWCEQFITKYINHLQPAERKNALAYNSAYLYFSNNEFNKAIRKLREVELNDVFYQLDSRVVILKSWYELDETESFFYHASAFRLFLLRNKSISEYQKTIYRNLIKFLSAVLRAGTSRTKLRSIRAAIEKEKNVADINWLLKKVEIAIG